MEEILRIISRFMQEPFIVAAITMIVSLVGGLFPLTDLLIKRKKPSVESYSHKLSQLTENLSKASSEVDSLLNELAQVAADREAAVQKLESELAKLEADEKQLQKRIQDLQNVPVPVAEHFAAIIEQGERRSAWRDYILFGSGVIVSTVIAIVLKLLGLG